MGTTISTTHQDPIDKSFEDVCRVNFTVYELNRLLEALLYSCTTSIINEWGERECVELLNLANRVKGALNSTGKPIELPNICLLKDTSDMFPEDPWVPEILDEYGVVLSVLTKEQIDQFGK